MRRAFSIGSVFIILILIFSIAACNPQPHPSRAKIVTSKPKKTTKLQPSQPTISQNPTSNNDPADTNSETPSQTRHYTEIHMLPDPDNKDYVLPEGWALGMSEKDYHVYHTSDTAKTLNDVTGYELLTTQFQGEHVIKGALNDKSTARVAISNLKNGTYETEIYGTNDAGRSWFGPVTLPSLHVGKGEIPVDIQFADAQGWVTTRIVSSGGENESRGGLYHSSDGGKTWSLVADTPKHHKLPDVNPSPNWNDWSAFWNTEIGFTTGQTRSTKEVLDSNSTALYETLDGGKHWKIARIAMPIADKEEHRIILKPTFVGRNIELPVVITNRNKSVLTVFESRDLGKTWVKNDELKVDERVTEALKVHVDAKHLYWFFTGKTVTIMNIDDILQLPIVDKLPTAVDYFDIVGNQAWAITSMGEVYVGGNMGQDWHKP